MTTVAHDADRIDLPFVLGPVSNGEFLPAGPSRRGKRGSTLGRAECSGWLAPRRRLLHPAARGPAGLREALGSRGEFIMDVHTHHVMPSLPWRTTAPATLQLVMEFVPPDCTASNPLTCVDRSAYLHDVFLASDTTVALLSDLPSKGASTDVLPFATLRALCR